MVNLVVFDFLLHAVCELILIDFHAVTYLQAQVIRVIDLLLYKLSQKIFLYTLDLSLIHINVSQRFYLLK